MNYEGEDDILSPEQIEELARQGLHPARPREHSPAQSNSSTDYPDLELTSEELARIDETENTHTSTAAPAPSPLQSTIGPLTYTDALREAAKKATGFYLHTWQIAIAWALYYGTRDVLVVAGTGYGKTLPFVLNLFLNSAMIIWIVSPLNYIEMEQVKVFKGWGLEAIAVNSMTMRPGLLKEIERGKYQVIISSIESMLASNKLRPILGSRKLAKWRQLLVLDEAHCISSWAESGFRPLYAMVGNLGRLLPLGTPVIAATATANKEVRASIQKVLAFRPNPYIAILGNFRSNLIYIVHHLQGAVGAVKEILYYFPSKTDLPMCLICVNSCAMGQLVYRTLWDYVDPCMRGRIHFDHAFRGNFGKTVLAEGFRTKVFRVLICTESLTMGADFRNVALVISFLCPSTLLTWIQRAGRGARDPELVCRVVLMAQPSLFEQDGAEQLESAEVEEVMVKEEAAESQDLEAVGDGETVANQEGDTQNATESQEHEEHGFGDINHVPNPSGSKFHREQRMTYTKSMLGYIRTTGCRNAYLDKEYGNPELHTTCTTCDNCLGLSPVSVDPNSFAPNSPDQTIDSDTENPIIWLRPSEREHCEARLREWRRAKWASAECADMDITVSYIMSDKVLTSIAKHPCINSVPDLATTSLVWPFYKLWGHEIIGILQSEQWKRHFKNCQSMVKKLVSKIKSKQRKAANEWKASGSNTKKRKEMEREQGIGTEIKVEETEKRIKKEIIEQSELGNVRAIGNTVSPGKTAKGKGKGKGRKKGASDAPLSRAEQLEMLAIHLPKPSTSQNPNP